MQTDSPSRAGVRRTTRPGKDEKVSLRRNQSHPPTYVIVVVVVIDVVVLMNKSLQYWVLLHTKLKVQAKVGIAQDHLEVVQTTLEKAEEGK